MARPSSGLSIRPSGVVVRPSRPGDEKQARSVPVETAMKQFATAFGVLALLLMRRCPDIHLVADTMLTSPRTLQRRLRDAGLTYARLMAETRREAAKKLLVDPTRTIAEVARALGYSDPAHFTRAFQRWTGCTPRGYRALPASGVGSDPLSQRKRRR
jgi:AraC-like DNA-binding protein